MRQLAVLLLAAAVSSAEAGSPVVIAVDVGTESCRAAVFDATGKNLLAVLRHVGRLKEFKHDGLRCWKLGQ